MIGIGLSIPKVASKPMLLPRRIAAILRKFGSEAHVFMAGVGRIDGFTTGNYLESTGQTHAVVDGAVGLVLDAAGTVGPELVVNGDFSNGTTGWVGQGATISSYGEKLSVTTSSGAGGAWQDVPTVAGKTYQVFAGFYSAISASLKVYVGGAFATLIYNGSDAAAIRQERAVFQAVSSSSRIYLRNTGISTCEYDNISVRELPGIHATQATTANKPTLRQTNGKYAWQFDGSNDVLNIGSALVSQTDDFFDCVGAVVFNKSSYPFVSYSAKSDSGNGVIGGMFVDAGGFLGALWKTDAGASTFVSNASVPVADGQTCVFAVEKSGSLARCTTNGIDGPQAAVPVSGITVNSAAIGTNNNGLIFARVLIRGAVSPADKKTLMKWIGSLSGVQIA